MTTMYSPYQYRELQAQRDGLLRAARHAQTELQDRAQDAGTHEERIYFAQVAGELGKAIRKVEEGK